MSNILTVPASGAIYFNSGVAGSSTIPSLTSSVALQYDNIAGMNITSYTIGASAVNRFSVDGFNGRLFSVSDALTGVVFSVNDAAGLPIIEVNSNVTDVIKLGTYGTNALVVNDTKVGIGTATPNQKLTVVGNISATDTIYSPSFTTGPFPTVGVILNSAGSAAGASYIDFFTYNSHSGQSVARMRSSNSYQGTGLLLTRNGFFGWNDQPYAGMADCDTGVARDGAGVIAQRNGTSSQETRIYRTYTDASNYERFFVNTNVGATNVTQIGLSAAGTGQNRNLQFVTGGSTQMTITSSGNVGIGTTTPQLKLDVNGDTRAGGWFSVDRTGGSLTSYLSIRVRGASEAGNFGNAAGNGQTELFAFNTSGLIVGTYGNSPLILATANTERVRILGTGNVGIGTTTPNEKLTVSGNISASGSLTLGNALAIAQGGTGGTSASTAITNLGIGTGVENTVLTESTSARTLGLTDAGKYIRFTSLSAITVTVPTDAVSDFPIASIVYLRRASTGVISLTADVAVTVNDNTSTAVPTGGVFALKKISANTWDFI